MTMYDNLLFKVHFMLANMGFWDWAMLQASLILVFYVVACRRHPNLVGMLTSTVCFGFVPVFPVIVLFSFAVLIPYEEDSVTKFLKQLSEQPPRDEDDY